MGWQMISKGLLVSGLIAGVCGLAMPAGAVEIASMTEKIAVDPAGAAQVEIGLKLAKAEPGTILIPSSFKTADNLKIEGLPDASVALVDKDGIRAFAITAKDAPTDKQTIKLTFAAPGFYDWKGEKLADFGNRSMQYRFMNTLPAKVQSYKLDLILPAGYVINTVDESQPRLTSKSPTPPYQIVKADDRYGISIKSSKLGVGDTCMVRFRFKDGSKSVGFLVASLAVCGLYLVGFRDSVRPPAPSSAPSDGRAKH